MIYAIGDVHGEAEALERLIERLPVQQTDLVVFLGDLINRMGKDPFRCVEAVLGFDRCRKVCLHGNHEDSFREYLEHGDPSVLTGMSAETTLESYESAGYPVTPGDPMSIPEAHARFYFSAEPWTLPFYITDDYIFTHAGWNLDRPIERQNLYQMHWGQVTGADKPVWNQTVVRGHSPVSKVTQVPAKQFIGVDTGCGMGGALSAFALPSEEIFTEFPASYRKRWRSRLASP